MCAPGANQNVRPGPEKSNEALSPGGTTTAPAGGVVGPSNTAGLPQMRAGGSVGRVVRLWSGRVNDVVGVAVGGRCEAACSRGWLSPAGDMSTTSLASLSLREDIAPYTTAPTVMLVATKAAATPMITFRMDKILSEGRHHQRSSAAAW